MINVHCDCISLFVKQRNNNDPRDARNHQSRDPRQQQSRDPRQQQQQQLSREQQQRQYASWKAEREQIDAERLKRAQQGATDGHWRREWDTDKV